MYGTPNVKRRVIVILGITLVFIAGLGAFLFWYLGGEEKAATQEANKFVKALVKHDATAAPKDGDDYVRGVWKAYRRVDSAKLIDTHQNSSNSNQGSGSSWWVADMLLHTGRGLVVLELAFKPNNIDPKDQEVDLLYELTPNRIHGGLLDSKTLARVKSDQHERGDHPENDITLDVSESEAAPVVRPRAPVQPIQPVRPAAPVKPKVPPVIRCIRRAHGDVNKIQRCGQRYN